VPIRLSNGTGIEQFRHQRQPLALAFQVMTQNVFGHAGATLTNCCNAGNPEPNKMTKDESPMSKEIQRQRLPARARY